MKFDKLCYFALTEKFEGKFIAINDNTEQVPILETEIRKLAKKPQINIKNLSKKFVRRMLYDLEYELPAPNEVSKSNEATQYSRDQVLEIIERKIALEYEVKSTKARYAAIGLFRLFTKKGIFKILSWTDIGKSKKSEEEELERAIGDPESEWLGTGTGEGPQDIESLTGGFGPERSDDFF